MYYVYEINDDEPISTGLETIEDFTRFIISWETAWGCVLKIHKIVNNLIFVEEV